MSNHNQCANLMHGIGLAQSQSIWDGCRKRVGCGAVTLPVLWACTALLYPTCCRDADLFQLTAALARH